MANTTTATAVSAQRALAAFEEAAWAGASSCRHRGASCAPACVGCSQQLLLHRCLPPA